ncbi:MAG: beta-lactamase family protein [Clostridia bacterium]|nr:beta-lactamase family protein [Clostridia bacterium]
MSIKNKMNCEDIGIKLDEYVDSYTQRGYFSGTVLVANYGNIVLSKGYGMANYEHDIPNTPRTKFRIASVTKPFTAMAVMLLYERDMLDVNDSISKYLPDYPGGEAITIHHLLTNTSGIPDLKTMPETLQVARTYASVDRVVEIFKDKPLLFSPGERFEYTNSGYILLGYIIEKVSGKPYDVFLDENIFKKLNMKDTGYDYQASILKNRACGYSISGNGLVNTDFIDVSILHSAGALYSTVEDLYLWDRALYTEQLVSRATIEKVFTPFAKGKTGGSYGYGWYVDDKLAYHGGWINGFSSHIGRYIDQDAVIIMLGNNDMASTVDMVQGLEAIVLGKEYELPRARTAIDMDFNRYGDYAGQYRYADVDHIAFSIFAEDNRMFIEYVDIARYQRIEIYPEADEKEFASFFAQVIDLKVTFKKNRAGNIEEGILYRHNYEFKGKKVN